MAIRHLSAPLVFAILTISSGAICSESYAGCVPDPYLMDLPDRITVFPSYQPYPGPREWNEMIIRSSCGPVSAAQVDLVFEDAEGILCWCATQTHPVASAITDAFGRVSIEVYAGGCLISDVPDVNPVLILANGIPLRRVTVNSPDIVDDAGVLAADGWNPNGTCIVKGNDGVYHTPNIVNNLVAQCSKFDQDTAVTDIVNSTDAVILTPFVVNNSSCSW